MPEPQLRKIRVNGVELAYFERNRPRPAHRPCCSFTPPASTGASGIASSSRWATATASPWSSAATGAAKSARSSTGRVVGEDVAAFIEALELSNLIGIGHSMGAHALVDAAAATGAFARLLLLDPTISDPEAYASSTLAFDLPDGIHPAARRFNAFASADDMMERLASKSAFPLYDPQTFRDYCEHGLIPSANGGMTLACPPEIEASVYMASRSNAAIFDAVASVDVPVLVVRAQAPKAERGIMDFASSPTWPGLANLFPQGRELHWPDVTHFIPMQAPDAVIGLVEQEVEAWRQSHGNAPPTHSTEGAQS